MGAEQTRQNPIVFFDAPCVLCNRSVGLLLRLDRRRQLTFASLQGETAAAMLSPVELGKSGSAPASVRFWDTRSITAKSAAIIGILRTLGGLWHLPAFALRLLPRPIGDWLYDQLADSRYEVFGTQSTCILPDQNPDRFLP